MQSLILSGLALLGVYHLIFRANLLLKRRRAAANSLRDASNQLRVVMSAAFFPKKVMNKDEYQVFKAVEDHIRIRHSGHRVMSQTSLGEIIGSKDGRAFECVNSKRVDVMVMGPFGDPMVVLEYQGGGHYQGKAAARDAVKREALRKAGVAYIEVGESHTPGDIQRMVDDAMSRTRA